ncbi:MAG: tol-pal system-associated acyl-CoA thioesterase [Sphingomonadales bacterium]
MATNRAIIVADRAADNAPGGEPVLPAMGRVSNGVHVLPVRVYYEDTDVAGIVYYANYLKFMERGRTDMLRLAGVDQSRLLARQDGGFVGFAVRRCNVDFLMPAQLDDALVVATRVIKIGAAMVDVEQVVRRGTDDLVRAEIRIACLKRDGRPRRIPVDVRHGFEALAEAFSQ